VQPKRVPAQDHPSATRPQPDVSDLATNEAVEKVLAIVPRGALALAAILLGIMLAGWLAFHFLLFLPRGVIE
jgi:hypothetical protein